jgi:hypothetical protein
MEEIFMEPVTRKEVFMKALAEGVEAPIEPITREEMYLAEQAKREAAGSGGGITPILIEHQIEVSTGKKITIERAREIMAAFEAGTPVMNKNLSDTQYRLVLAMGEREGSGGLTVEVAYVRFSGASASIATTDIYASMT